MKLRNLKTNFLGRDFYFYEEIDSTQNEIFRRIKKGQIINGSVIMADIQTAGKGTHGRIWHTDEKGNIAFSFYIQTNCEIERLDGLTIDIAKILVDMFREKYKINIQIKVPNDLMINNKKIGGILTQGKINGKYIKYLVIGIGININKKYFTNDIKDIATSIKNEFKVDIDREEVIAEFCNIFEKEINRRIKV